MTLRPPRLPALCFLVAWLALFAPAVACADDPFVDNGRPSILFWGLGAATLVADQPLYDAAQRLDSPGTHKAAVFFNNFGDARVQIGTFALFALVGGTTDKAIARRGLHGLVAGGLVVAAVKELTRKSRPYSGRGPTYFNKTAPDDGSLINELAGHSDSNKSFPSGHSMAAFSLATVWAHERPRDRELVYALAALAGLSRINLKQHWPSDVFFGAAIGVGAGNAAVRGVPFGLMFRVY